MPELNDAPSTFLDLVVAVLVSDGIPAEAAIGQSQNRALRALKNSLRSMDEFSDYSEPLPQFLDDVRESESHSIDTFHHRVKFSPTPYTKGVILTFVVVAENGLPTYSGCGTSLDEAIRDIARDIKTDSDFSDFSMTEQEFLDELSGDDEGSLGESEEYGFRTFQLEICL